MADRVRAIVVPELNLGQLAHEVEWAVAGKVPVHKVNRVDGEPLAPQEVLARLRELV
jgi:2-oxoglutarate ferredoxin oxidoreductase subunit alpha